MHNEITLKVRYKVEPYCGVPASHQGGIPGQVHDPCQRGKGQDMLYDCLQHEAVVPCGVEVPCIYGYLLGTGVSFSRKMDLFS